MKFSFEHKTYRDNLANELKTERKTDKDLAQTKLEQERESLKYKVSRDIKNFFERNKNKQDSSITLEKTTEKKTVVQEIKLNGIDGKEHILTVTTEDISDRIPDEIKSTYDVYRLLCINRKLGDMSTRQEETGNEKSFWETVDSCLDSKDDFYVYFYLFLNRKEFSEYLNCPENEKDNDRYKELEEIFNKLNIDAEDYSKKRYHAYQDFMNTITNGGIKSPDMFNHVIGAFEEGYDSWISSEKISNIKKQYPHKLESQSDMVGETELDVSNLKSHYLWVSSNGSQYMNNYIKPIIIIDPYNERLREALDNFGFYKGASDTEESYNKLLAEIHGAENKNNPSYEETMKAALLTANSYAGIRLSFKGEIPWSLIAKQIIDPYHGRLITISEKDKE
jgi:hypothetical protein